MTPAKASGSNHLRHCPKHKKPLPCAHCALVKPKPLERPTPEPPAEPSVSVANEITVAVSPAAARAKRWREEQKKNNPDFEKQEAERKKAERAEADRREGIEKIVHSNPDPAFVVSDAPHGKGLIVTGGYDGEKISKVAGPSKFGRVKPKGFGAKDFEKNNGEGANEAVKKIAEETLHEFAPRFHPSKEGRLLRKFAYSCTFVNQAGEIVCGLCKDVLGGFVHADVTERVRLCYLHMEKRHDRQLQILMENLKKARACKEDHKGWSSATATAVFPFSAAGVTRFSGVENKAPETHR